MRNRQLSYLFFTLLVSQNYLLLSNCMHALEYKIEAKFVLINN